jgi:hypothetical protein
LDTYQLLYEKIVSLYLYTFYNCYNKVKRTILLYPNILIIELLIQQTL